MSCQAALALTSPTYERPPKTLEAQENRTCSDCCTTAHSGAWGAFFTATWSHMYTCSYVCTSVSLENFLGISAVQCCMCGTVVGFSLTVRFFHQDSNKPSFRYVTVEQMFQTGRELIHRAMLHVWHSCQSQACWNALSSKEV